MLCPVMQMDFTDGTGRYDDRGGLLYSDADLRYGVLWAETHLAEGIASEPMKGYDLRAFGGWCRMKLAEGQEGTVYLLHFDRRFKHAGHYLGWTRDLDRRVRRHLARHGSRLVRAVLLAGITLRVARTWVGGRERERQLKKQGGRARLCPICKGCRKGGQG